MRSPAVLLLGASLSTATASSIRSTMTTTSTASTPTADSCASSCSVVPSTRFLPLYHCQDPGSISTPSLISSSQSTSGDYTSCYTTCWASDRCVSFSYNSDTQDCELYSKTVKAQKFTSDASSLKSFWNIRGCFGIPQIACADSTPSSTPSATPSSTPSATPTPALTCAGAIEFPSDPTVPFLIQWARNTLDQPVYAILSLGTVQYNIATFAVGDTTRYTSGSTAATYTLDPATGQIVNGLMNADFVPSVFTPATDESRVQFQSQRYYGNEDDAKVLSWTYDSTTGRLLLVGTENQQYTPIYCESPSLYSQDINIIKAGTAMPAGCGAACPAAVVPAQPQILARQDTVTE